MLTIVRLTGILALGGEDMSYKLFICLVLGAQILFARDAFICVTNSHEEVSNYYESFELGAGYTIYITEGKHSTCEKILKIKQSRDLYFVEGKLSGLGEPIFKVYDKGIYKLNKGELKTVKDPLIFIKPLDFSNSKDRRRKSSFKVTTTQKKYTSLDRDRLLKYLREISGEARITINDESLFLKNRSTPAGRKLTQSFLKEFFEKLGFETKVQCFKAGYFGRKGCNIEATVRGTASDKFFAVGAHFDSATENCADDNGSGISTLMSVAMMLSKSPPDIGVKLVAFDLEEVGILGSKAYVKAALNEGVEFLGAFIVDTMGYDSNSDGKMHVIDCNRKDSTALAKLMVDSIGELNYGLKVVDKCTNRSDHSSFWNRNIPAFIASENFFGGDANKCYHKKCDTISNMNLGYFYEIADSFSMAVFKAVNN
jgi:hypothetical protein